MLLTLCSDNSHLKLLLHKNHIAPSLRLTCPVALNGMQFPADYLTSYTTHSRPGACSSSLVDCNPIPVDPRQHGLRFRPPCSCKQWHYRLGLASPSLAYIWPVSVLSVLCRLRKPKILIKSLSRQIPSC